MTNNKIQNFVVKQITEYLEEKTGAKFEIGYVSLKFFNEISLQDVYAEDLSHEKLLTIEELNAKIKLFDLFKGDVNFKDITANNLYANLYTNQSGTLNIQFLIDAFKPKKKKDTPNLIFPFITLNNASFQYKNYSAQPSELLDWQFDVNDIYIDSLYTQVQFTLIDQTNLNAKINHLQFKEKSGFVLSHLSTHAEITDSSFVMSYANIHLPNTNFTSEKTTIKISRDKNNAIVLGKTDLHINITQAILNLSDLKYFIPEFELLTQPITIAAKIDGTLDNLKATNLQASYGNKLAIDANIEAYGLPNITETYFKCAINDIQFDKASLQDIISSITKRPLNIPAEISNLGTCHYSGEISGYTSNLVLYGNLKSNIGDIRTDVTLKIRDNFNQFLIDGRIASSLLKLKKLLPKSDLGDISFSSNSNIKIETNKPLSAKTNIKINSFSFKDYTYKNIKFDGDISPTLFSGKLLIDDPNIYFNFDGKISQINKVKHFDFKANLQNLNLHKLNIIKTRPNLTISLSTESDFSGDRWSNMAGYINIDSLHLKNTNSEFLLDKLSLKAENEQITAATIESDIINGGISGKYTLYALTNNLMAILSNSIPVLQKYVKPTQKSNDITCLLEIESLKPLLQTIEFPWYTTDKTSIYAHLNSKTNQFETKVYIPQISNGKINVDSIDLNINNKSNKTIDLTLSLATDLKRSHLNALLNIKALNNNITTTINWDNNSKKLFAGELITQTALSTNKKRDSIFANTTVLPTEIILQNKSWLVNNSTIWSDFSKIIIDNFKLQSNDQQLIAINGIASKNRDELINIQLKDISLDYIDELLPEGSAISFGGIVNGEASIANTFILPEINANVISNNFFFDESYFGTAKAKCQFDHQNTSLKFDGTIISDNNDTTAILDGNYFISKDSLDIRGKAYGLDVAFLDYYMANVIGNIRGNAWGDIHIHGITKSQKVAVDVAAYAQNASIYVDFLKTAFYFSDSIFVDKNTIDFGHINFTDAEGHSGSIQGSISHKYFKDFNLDLNFKANNMLVMNTTRQDVPSFYGKVYATGTARIYGDTKQINISCLASSNKGTNVVIPMDNYYATENSFILFQDLNSIDDTSQNNKENTTTPKETNIVLDLMLDITPDAHLDLILDTKAGDVISGNGSGNLRVTYDINADKMNIYGTVQIEQGKYLFTFQNVIRKEFFVKNGSSISWTGDPIAANLNIDAYHQLTADLSEILDEAVLSNTSRTSVPVQCILNLTGLLTQPNVKFNINLPNSEEELNRALQNTVNTDELMNRQIIALLILGKFIPPENLQSSNIFTQNELYSVVSSTLSAQLNNWASQMFDNWNFGINFRTIGEGETRTNEYEFNFNYNPTNRISINGNLGYRDDALSATPFIGDFDFEYKLIQSGKLRAKAYTHTNDYREFKKGLTTQGIGLIYSENFNNLSELWKGWIDNAKKAKAERIQKKQQRKQKREQRKQQKQLRKLQQ